MSLADDIQRAQVEAGERAVINNLQGLGLIEDQAPKQTARQRIDAICIPILHGASVRIVGMPIDLSHAEAKKICDVVMAYTTQTGISVPAQDGN